uniref:Uncharacterized protein n=1 Tax=Candidatus Kentrum sp. SD TaxID=2126332 RepID=A0A451BNR6_9GAMM|nr:MAG: hypothetical protein BECKSD772D_GA0070982_10762 [Candidatus Kentron sp. SD]
MLRVPITLENETTTKMHQKRRVTALTRLTRPTNPGCCFIVRYAGPDRRQQRPVPGRGPAPFRGIGPRRLFEILGGLLFEYALDCRAGPLPEGLARLGVAPGPTQRGQVVADFADIGVILAQYPLQGGEGPFQ